MSDPLLPPAWPARDAAHLLVTSSQMASLEATLFASGLPVEALMEKAALAVSRQVLELLLQPSQECVSDPFGKQVLVLVGPGHNGGDGLVVARELHLAGFSVRIWSPFERRKPLTEAHLSHARWLGVPLLVQAPDPADPSLWIDALFGIGQNRAPEDAVQNLLSERHSQRPGALVAIDAPTGICADTGIRLGHSAARAQATFCIGLIKQGLVQDTALAWVGRLVRIDLGLPAQLLKALPPDLPLGLGSASTVISDQATAPWPCLDPSANKYGRGRLLVVAGSRCYRGAAHLSLSGASSSGCGSLRAALPDDLAATLWQVHPHVVIESGLDASPAGGLALERLDAGWLERLDAVLLGPGIGADSRDQRQKTDTGPTGAGREKWLELQNFAGLLVLDADGLNRLTELYGPELGARAWLQQRSGPTWITPHRGEFDRLFPDLVNLSPLRAAAEAALSSGASVLLKGARSVVASPDGRRWQILEACPDAARAGLGDVLAGYAAGRGAMAMASSGGGRHGGDGCLLAAAVLDHARAAMRVQRNLGAGSVTPGEVAEALKWREKTSC